MRAHLVAFASLCLAACASAPGSAMELNGSKWHLVAADRGALATHATDSGLTLEFTADRIDGNTGCNVYTAGYSLEGDKFNVVTVSATKRGCPGAAGEVERAWLATLRAGGLTLTQDADGLRLQAADGATLRFAAGAAPATP